jgi:hypothetical protein
VSVPVQVMVCLLCKRKFAAEIIIPKERGRWRPPDRMFDISFGRVCLDCEDALIGALKAKIRELRKVLCEFTS